MQLQAELEDESGLPPLPSPITRRCSACGKQNDRARAKYCRECGRIAQQAWRAIRRAQPARGNEASIAGVGAPSASKPSVRAQTEEEREIIRARAYVSSNLRRGKITKKACAICFDSHLDRIGPYHPDPSKRMAFIWLCGPCGRRARMATKATIEQSTVQKRKQTEYEISLAEHRDRARAAVQMIAALDASQQARVSADIACVYEHFRWPLRPSGVLFQDVALFVYGRIIGPLDASSARAYLAHVGVPLFSENAECDVSQTWFTH